MGGVEVTARSDHGRRRHLAALIGVTVLLSACGSRLSATQFQGQQGGGGGSLGSSGGAALGSAGGGAGSPSAGGSAARVGGAHGGAKGGGALVASGSSARGGSGPHGAVGAAAAAGGGAAGAGAPAGGNGGATDTGVTANSITIANIASITGVAPGLTQSAQQATEAFAAYANSQGGLYGRQLKVQPFDDQNDSGQNYADAEQACSSAFALVGSASGFDDGGAQAVGSCGIPNLAAELSTTAAGNTANAFGASPGNAHYWPLGPAEYLKSTYPSAITKAAMIYLNVPATQQQASHEMAAYRSVGFNYVYTASVTPTEPNYAPYVLQMQQKGVQYVTEYSDASSAVRLLQAMQQQNFHPQVVDWFSEEYSPSFLSQTQGMSDGDLVLMATSAYEEAQGNPEMQLYLSWLNRVAPGATHDIFGILAWSACEAFWQAAKAAGAHLTRRGLIQQIQQITNWTGNGMTPPVDIGGKRPSNCFDYFKISGSNFTRAYPGQPNGYSCSGGLYSY